MTLGLSIGLRGLRAAQAALDTVGHNISNANTPGYTRQRVDLDTSRPTNVRGILQGTGVETAGIRSITDALLSRRIPAQVSVLHSLDIQLQGMSRVEELLSEPGEYGLGSLFDGFFSSVSQLSTDPGDIVLRNSMVQSALNLTDEFNHLSTAIRDARSDNLQELTFHVGEVNRLAQGLQQLNAQIVQAEATQLPANDLRDQRGRLVQELAEQVDITVNETDSGALLVSVDGHALVGSQRAYAMRVDSSGGQEPQIYVEGSQHTVEPQGGEVGGLLRFRDEFIPDLESQLDELASQLILEVNRSHSTGTTEEGGFTLLSSTAAVSGENQAQRLASLLRDADLPFEIQDGRLYVNITHDATGEVQTHAIDIDVDRMSVAGFLSALNDVPNMNAGLDSLGRLNLFSDSGYRFDFSARLDSEPNDFHSMGGGRATLGSGSSGPYNLVDGGILSLQGNTGTANVVFNAADFGDIANATAQEIAEVINGDPNVVAAGVRAAAVGDRLVLQSLGEGTGQTVSTLGGSMVGNLGFSAGASAAGRNNSMQVEAFGRYTGSQNRTLYYEPVGDGTIGSTPGLQIRVTSEDGSPVAVLDVGEGYIPGTRLSVGDGVEISFGFGEISASQGEVFKQDWIADSDSSDVLVAFGVNSFFTGNSAGTIDVAQELQDDPNRLAYSGSGTSGDNGALLSMLNLQDNAVDALGVSIPEFYSQVVGDVGFQISSTQSATQVAASLVESLEARRDEVSGVNVDEELVNMVRFEQAYSASARYIQVVQQLNDTILSIL